MRAILYYNENKVDQNEARLILASGFAGEAEKLDRQQKLKRFSHLLRLKPNVKTNAVHITLNFHSSEKLGDDKLQQISMEYMERIGFGEQPFLVYRHFDAAHTHMHIVSTNITSQGQRIDLHNIGAEKSEVARRAIEKEFELVRAESKEELLAPKIKKAELKKVKHGHLPTKRAISNVLTAVNRDYKFTSLAEYNAVLGCFNVIAIRGEPDSAMFERKGLMYSVIGGKGQPVGVPIKASTFYIKPTLRNLENRFAQHNEKRKAYKPDLKERIDKLFTSYRSVTRKRFIKDAEKQGIAVLFRQNESGQVFGVTYVDHKQKCVFNGSDLGKDYSAKAMMERLASQTKPAGILQPILRAAKRIGPIENNLSSSPSTTQPRLLEDLLAPTLQDTSGGKPKRKKKKKKQQQVSI
ncbi:relaxase/mobilization nuclease domain-containing protein [Pedobacter ureilyticus]|uniref:Relaxase/mobilization nuclease domain-containing protein n=1 Tax=Pedobacter ureilyticus TaxID=1393051 RepID=A0ABW9JBJ4_9SPHI|nr:relaxase/mobilization nuclease domain-containing protein [Pedobacter helvus]